MTTSYEISTTLSASRFDTPNGFAGEIKIKRFGHGSPHWVYVANYYVWHPVRSDFVIEDWPTPAKIDVYIIRDDIAKNPEAISEPVVNYLLDNGILDEPIQANTYICQILHERLVGHAKG